MYPKDTEHLNVSAGRGFRPAEINNLTGEQDGQKKA